jgi:two-component system, NarL family, nitrate/nitrite response regulator NarL
VVNERVRAPLALVRVLRTLVVDDVAPGRGGVAAALAAEPGMEVVGETANVEHAFALAAAIAPDVILLAPNLAQTSNGDVVNKLRGAAPDAHIMMLARAEESQALAEGLRAGASGYLVRDLDSGLMADALRCTVEHGGLFGYRAKIPVEARPSQAPASPLSPREQQILTLVAEGWTNKQIARELGIAESTIKIHIQHILRKLKLESRVQAAVYAAENGFAAKH